MASIRAERSAAALAPTALLAPFVRQKTVALTTYRRDGTPVTTPVNIAVEGDHAYIRTWSTTGKWKRFRHDPNVDVTPSTFFGKPTGPGIRALARPLEGAEAEHAARLIGRKYPILQGILVPLVHRVRRQQTTHAELTPVEAVAGPVR
jgi:PPOX class probable F420-dependent enzyme